MIIILLRIGLDSGYGGDVAPIFEDSTFEYVPIPEYDKSSENRIYSETYGRHGKLLSLYVGPRYKNMKIHFDPEFETFTYGDHLKKGKVFGNLQTGDYVVFYAGLRPYHGDSPPRGLYIIGFFCVDRVYIYKDLVSDEILNLLKNNAHVKRGDIAKDTVIVKGNPSKSRLLDKAIRISNIGSEHWVANDQFCKIIGRPCGYNMMRSSPRTIKDENAMKLINFIKGS